MKWEYSKNTGGYWCASRKMPDGVFDFIYCISKVENGYIAEASNNAYGACRVAVKNNRCVKESVFHNLEKLMEDIKNGNILWLYTSHCNCVGKVTKEEY